ncbi:sorting nexin-15 isoform X2 [Dasypus novemcinctus]|uniref:sorting nexin-15 isoform X2 n=1 Tax=Dasypus novemcinctus TaxID=9361 RepID=UPI00265F22C1|nr:sorting nexin-15 isoform X2 [Dasypus novemcinctus]
MESFTTSTCMLTLSQRPSTFQTLPWPRALDSEQICHLRPAPWARRSRAQAPRGGGWWRQARRGGGAGEEAQAGGELPSGSAAMSRQAKDDFLRHYTVSDPRTHPKGYTEYKVTAQFISKKDPEDVKEVVVWKRYSDFRKLHGDLAYTHRNLFRRLEEFPSFPRAQVFGRFEAAVIEERRKGAEDLLRFTVHIPALNNSPQLKEFFRGGEVTRLSEVSRDLHILPPPLTPTLPPDERRLLPDEPLLPQLLPAERRDLEELEVPADPPPSSPAQEALDLLFNCGSPEEASSPPARGPLTEAELALFDPFSKEGDPSPARREGVKKKAAEYLKRAEEILHLHQSQVPP